ncbi:transaldolase [Spirulina subsalsa FACHB-351]|uniref:Transaldolase n=1 Tax=Spirulina subsalsa FACHB-351 TaxID=234711 RepID=A0ABT3L5M3_9CYAN|nr:transaldolase family protein [Spirulina subsalsa]MCW6036492.1 transaldolase [Spirulina subsalsa FACHB-351]
MVLYLDSAQIEEAQQVIQWGWVKGITTNPTLLAKSPLPPLTTLEKLTAICPGELYYQLTSVDFEGMVQEAAQAREVVGEKLVLKIPATPLGFTVAAHLSGQIACSITAIYSAAQAVVAAEAGAKYAIAYVNRASRLLGDGIALVYEMAQVLQHTPTQILAASLKSSAEAAGAIQAGAHHLTLPLAMLQALTSHEYSEQTVEEFRANGRGIAL